MRVIVDYQERCDYSEHEGVQYGSWSESYTFDILTVRAASEKDATGYGSEGYQIPDGSTHAHVVWMSYDTGDSFGRATGKGAIIGVFGNRKIAEQALEALKKQEDEFSVEVKDDFGRKIKLWNPGAGYFESINSINLDSYDLANQPIRYKKH